MKLDAIRHAAPPRPSVFRAHLQDLRCELLRMLREPMYVIPTLLFPALFYAMFGLLMGGRSGGGAAQYLLATYGVFGTLGAALFGFGVTVANDRERGLFALRRALPAPPSSWITARLAKAMLFSLVVSLELALLASVFGGVSLSPMQWAALWGINVLGAIPFGAIGLLLGVTCSANAAPAVVNILFLPMAFLSGLWLPLSMLPDVFARLAPVWPAWHHAQLALGVVGQDAGGAPWLHAGALVATGLVCAAIALRRLARVG